MSLKQFIKRIIDITFALGVLILSFPVMLVIIPLIRYYMGSPVFFKQQRPGLKEKPFVLYKFRTMKNAYDENGTPLPDSVRMTTLGKLLRKLSLDELPQFINVLKGDMSVVGPRPLLMEYLPLYNESQKPRHWVKPGITGWAQVNGRNAITWEQKFQLDVWYVYNWSLMLDFKIMLMTAWKIFKREGVSATGHVTMPAFTGTPEQEQETDNETV